MRTLHVMSWHGHEFVTCHDMSRASHEWMREKIEVGSRYISTPLAHLYFLAHSLMGCAWHVMTCHKFVTMSWHDMSCSHVSGEAEWPGDWSLYRLPAVTLHLECHDRYYGNNWHKSGCQVVNRGGEVINFFLSTITYILSWHSSVKNPMLMTLTRL